MAIDLHAHWIPRSLADALRRRRAAPRIDRTAGREELVTFQRRQPFGAHLQDLAARRALMKGAGVRLQMLSLPGLFGVDCLPAGEASPLVRAFNDAAAAATRADPQHFRAVAALPLADVGLACAELRRAHAMGLAGAILPADALAERGAADRLLPLFEAGHQLRCHFFIHPGPTVPSAERDLPAENDGAWQRHIVLRTQAVLGEAFFTLEFTGFLDPFPGLTVQVANLGGTLPFLLERRNAVIQAGAKGGDSPPPRPRRCYVDTASFGARSIELAVRVLGAERIVLGTDTPLFAARHALEAVHAARLDTDQRRMLLSGNAGDLLARHERACAVRPQP